MSELKNVKKEIVIGILVGIIANTLGTLLYILLFSDLGIQETFQAAIQQGHVGSLLALGAILNLIAFFLFLMLAFFLAALRSFIFLREVSNPISLFGQFIRLNVRD